MEARAEELNAFYEVPDEELAKKAPHDFEAFAELYRRYLYPIYRFVRSQTPNDAVAEDITAQVFFKALSSAHTYRGEASYSSWLYRVTHNVILTWRKRSRKSVAVEEMPERVDPTPSPVSQVITGEARNLIWRTIADLPPAQREVVALRYLKDFSNEEIARITERTRGAVRILLHRAKAKLRKTLERGDV
jgi:RNA polymerase sigma-70 factor, ECF subfamily